MISGKEAAKKVIEDISSSHTPPKAVSAPPLKALVIGAGECSYQDIPLMRLLLPFRDINMLTYH